VTRRRLSGRAWAIGALACATLMRGLRGLAAIFEGVARLIRTGAQQLERASVGARARANPAPAEDRPAPPPGPVPVADKTVISASAFLAPAPPALPPPRPQRGRGAVLPPPRRTEWRAALEAKRLAAEATEPTQAAAAVDTPSEGTR